MGLSQGEFGHPAGISQYRMSRIEKSGEVTMTEARAMENARGIRFQWTLDGEGSPLWESNVNMDEITKQQLEQIINDSNSSLDDRAIAELARSIGLTKSLLIKIRNNPTLKSRFNQLLQIADADLIKELENLDS